MKSQKLKLLVELLLSGIVLGCTSAIAPLIPIFYFIFKKTTILATTLHSDDLHVFQIMHKMGAVQQI